MLFRTAVAAAALLLAACQASETNNAASKSETGQRAEIAPILATADAKDDASYARPLEARVHHVTLDLTVDFDAKRVGGTATLDIDRKADAKEIVLDDKGLEIASITDGSDQPLDYKVGASDPKLGAPLTVALRPDTRRLVIKYKSAPTRARCNGSPLSRRQGRRNHICSVRVRRSRTEAGSRRRIHPASARPGKPPSAFRPASPP